MLEATLALATIIRRTEIDSREQDFPLAVPMTTVAAGPSGPRQSAEPRVKVWIVTNPYLENHFAPLQQEYTLTDLEVAGDDSQLPGRAVCA